MYKSPIELIYKDAQYRMEKGIFYAIQKVDINVDRDELLKALAYDRGQYEKGYEDAKAERKRGEWIGKPIAGYCTVRCSVCKDVFRENNGRWNFCPTCGAEMREEEADEKPEPRRNGANSRGKEKEDAEIH